MNNNVNSSIYDQSKQEERQQSPTVPVYLPVIWNDTPVVTTDTLADEFYETEPIRLRQNHQRNTDKFVDGKHYFKLKGAEVKDFRLRVAESYSQNEVKISPKTRSLILWTERGAARHAKMLETDKAWEVFEALEDTYFNQPIPTINSLSCPLTPAHQREIQKLVGSKVHASNAGRGGYSTIYKSIKDQFHVGTYKDVPDDRYEDLRLYIESIELQDGELLRTLPLSHDQISMIIEAVTEKINAEYIHTSKQGSEPNALAPPPKPPAKRYPPRTLYDLDYIKDLRGDDSQVRNVDWWQFERPGGETNWAGDGTFEQGEHFFQQTRELAKSNPKDAVQAITWCLMHFTGGDVEGVGHHGCELKFCEQVARAAVAWMAAAHELQPPSYEVGRRRAG